jgi:phosphoribosylformylglycinamidine synthase
LVPQASRPGVVLFSESNSRFLIEVSAESAGRLREIFGSLPLLEIGRTTARSELRVTCGEQTLIQAGLDDLRECWQKPLRF